MKRDSKLSMHNSETIRLGLTEQMVEDLRRARVLTKFLIAIRKYGMEKRSTTAHTLFCSFNWSDTPEGFDFWKDKWVILKEYNTLRRPG